MEVTKGTKYVSEKAGRPITQSRPTKPFYSEREKVADRPDEGVVISASGDAKTSFRNTLTPTLSRLRERGKDPRRRCNPLA
jgi:hypothetical protein